MPEDKMTKERKPRKPAARPTDVVIGGLEENVFMLGKTADPETIAEIAQRLSELLDELKRSRKGSAGEEDSE